MPPKIELYVSSISSTLKLRNATEAARRCLRGYEVTEIDIASDEAAKSVWKRKSTGPTDLPLILVDGNRPGSVEQLEEAVEYGEVKQFLFNQAATDDDADLANISEADADKLLAELGADEKDVDPYNAAA